jgi:hypothetical protein
MHTHDYKVYLISIGSVENINSNIPVIYFNNTNDILYDKIELSNFLNDGKFDFIFVNFFHPRVYSLLENIDCPNIIHNAKYFPIKIGYNYIIFRDDDSTFDNFTKKYTRHNKIKIILQSEP